MATRSSPPTGSGVGEEIFLDHNSTTPPLPSVVEAMVVASAELWGNPSSVHAAGRRARNALESTRERLATLLGFHPRDVLFTSGGTESNNLALQGREALILSRLDHPSVVKVAERDAARGRQVIWLPVEADGTVRPAAVAEALGRVADAASTRVVVTAANHETGVCQPLEAIAEVVRSAGARLHVDAVQWLGKAPVAALGGADSLSVTAHKLRGPKGIGALLFRGRAPEHVLVGGAQERGLRPGTQDAVAAVGFGVALEHAERGPERYARLAELRDDLERRLADVASVNGAARRLPHVSNLSFPSFPGPELVAALDLQGVRVSSGSACSAGTSEPSPVIEAMLGRARAEHAVRFSMGERTTEEQIQRAIAAVFRVLDTQP